ncbi:MAG: 50S ribosomal protein L11 methyltransferase [Bacteroidales bacterium]|nr:50S ribosomal protein L11 methyltransferase [Bacteroidales bacterium]
MAYFEFEIPIRSWNSNEREILLAKLSLIGFEGFIENDDLIQAYIRKDQFSGESFNHVIDDLSRAGLNMQYRFHETVDHNWNEEWEKKFAPVVIKEKVLIRAPFHDGDGDLPCTLIIEPKMSFGTGHHHTTRLMIEAMMEHDLRGKRVLDMGCGTGVLGIYACKLGAERVLGVDNDQWAYENALENVERNGASAMEVRLGDAGMLKEEGFDVVLANITRNTLVRGIPVYKNHLETGGLLVVSGILAEDVQFILNAAYQCGLDHLNTREESNWISLSFVKP